MSAIADIIGYTQYDLITIDKVNYDFIKFTGLPRLSGPVSI